MSSDGIATALQDSASALMEGGNNLEQAVALVASANRVVQDPSSVGSALRTISLRLRGTSVEILEEMGEETDGVVESVSKMQEKIKALSGVNILTDAGAYKDTYTILYEIGQVWEDMDDLDQAALLELMAGKNRANTLSAILSNMKDLEGAYNDALNAEGSALKENEAYLDSIQGRIDLFNNSVQTMWMNFIDDDVVKTFVDIGTWLVKLVNLVNPLTVAFAGLMSVLVLKKKSRDKKTSLLDYIFDTTFENISKIKDVPIIQELISTIKTSYASAMAGAAASTNIFTAALIKAKAGLIAIKDGFLALWAAHPYLVAIAGAAVALTAIFTLYKKYGPTHENYVKKLDEETTALKDIQSELSEVNNELSTTKSRIEELEAKDSLSFVEQEELNKLKEQTAELERQEKILEAREKRKRGEQVNTALNAVKTDPNLQSNSGSNVPSYVTGDVSTSGSPYAAAALQQQANSNLYTENSFEKNLKLLKEAKEDVAAAEEALATTTYDTESKEYKKLEQELQEAQNRLKGYNSNLDTMRDKWQTEYGEVGYIEGATTKQEKAWNEFYNKYQDYVDQQELINGEILKSDVLDRVFGEQGTELAQTFNEKFEAGVKDGKNPTKVFEELLNDDSYFDVFTSLASKFGITADDVLAYFTQVGNAIAEDDIIPVQSYSDLTSVIESYNEALSQTSEILVDGTKVTQEYKDSLKELGISEEDLADCFDDTNPLIVKNASALNKLVKSSKNNIAQNAKLAKSQARLQYYELYKQIRQLVNGQQVTNKATLNQVNSLYAEMNALEKTISRYAMLETELLGAANAYEKFELAQETDSATDYIGSTESMILALGEAFNTAELGTESAQAAIAGLVPESVYEDLDTVDEKMAAIYDYFKNGKIAQYFDLAFDEDGNITSAEMKLGNLRKFIEDGLSDTGANVFDGSDWQHFEFSDEFMSQLDNLPENADKLQFFADKMGVTKEVAFAFIKSLEDHDIEWLNGDYSSMFEDLLPENLENDIYENVSALADLEVQLANGEITADEYAKKLAELSEISNQNAQKARENATSWIEASNEVNTAKAEVERLTKELIALKESGASENEIQVKTDELGAASQVLSEALQKKYNLEEPTEVTIKLALDDIDSKMEQWRANNSELNVSVVPKLQQDKNGQWTIPADVEATLDEKEKIKIQEYLGLLNDQYTIQVLADNDSTDSTKELEAVKTAAEAAQDAIDNIKNPSIDTTEARTALNNLAEQINSLPSAVVKISTIVTESTVPHSSNAPKSSAVGSNSSSRQNTIYVNGTAHANGNWGLPNNEHNSLVGELGPEMIVNPYTGRYYTVGDHGAEMVDLPKGAIIFNHKQTEGLLKNGYITSRGRAYAEGNAHVTIWPQGSSKTQWEGTGYSSWDDPTYDLSDALSDAADSISDAADEFKEVFDWIEVRLEEIEERLSLFNAQLDNATNYASKNNIIDQIIGINETKMTNLAAGIAEYAEYASKLLTKIPAQYQDAAQNGAIAIKEFAGEADEATVEAINNYREWAQKVADLKQELEGVKTEIRDLAVQKIDNAYDSGDVRATVEASQTEKLQNAVDLIEESGRIADDAYYTAMMENSNKTIEYLTAARKEMQKEFNDAVTSGTLIKGSDEWYENLDKLYQIDSEIDSATKELEEFQNAINDIYWDNFDQLINRLDYLKDETQGLIDLMDSDDMVDHSEDRQYTVDGTKYWTADDVEWTKEGLASLGLYAQQMEIAERKARQYAKAIDDLKQDFDAGKYSENEYLEKLNELTNAQYDSIEAYYDAQDAIKDLNETRIDSIKEGIEKEIEAFEELIKKQKEELDINKDMHDFQESVTEKQQNIATIQRKLAAIANDNSISATAQRKRLEAELAEAQHELDELYYDRSIEDKQNALDKELELFQNEKAAETERLDEYLTNVEQVVTDSLITIQANASGIYDTLSDKADEYNLTLSEAILTPWQDGALAVSDYQTAFDTAASSTTDQLDILIAKWQDIIDKMDEAAKSSVEAMNAENAAYAAAKNPVKTTTTSKPSTTTNSKPATSTTNSSVSSGPAVGSSVTVKGSATHFSGNSGGVKMASFVPGGSYTVYQVSGGQVLIGRGGVYTGWVNKSDLVGYAKGTTGVKENQFAWIDELGEELVIRPQGGRMTFLEKGTSVIPADLTANLMEWGQLDPSMMLEQNKPVISAPHITNNETVINIEYGDILHIDNFSGDKPENLSKMIDKAFDKHMKELNSQIRRYAR